MASTAINAAADAASTAANDVNHSLLSLANKQDEQRKTLKQVVDELQKHEQDVDSRLDNLIKVVGWLCVEKGTTFEEVFEARRVGGRQDRRSRGA